jgi:hypothetical protein
VSQIRVPISVPNQCPKIMEKFEKKLKKKLIKRGGEGRPGEGRVENCHYNEWSTKSPQTPEPSTICLSLKRGRSLGAAIDPNVMGHPVSRGVLHYETLTIIYYTLVVGRLLE